MREQTNRFDLPSVSIFAVLTAKVRLFGENDSKQITERITIFTLSASLQAISQSEVRKKGP